MVRRISFIVCLAVSVAMACRENPVAPADVPLGQPFDLRVGASALLPGGLKVTFDRVISDSRCPMDAICVWAGEAVLAMKLAQGADAPVEHEVRADVSSPELIYRTYRIKATALAPYPRSDRKTPPQEFVATLVVTSR